MSQSGAFSALVARRMSICCVSGLCIQRAVDDKSPLEADRAVTILRRAYQGRGPAWWNRRVTSWNGRNRNVRVSASNQSASMVRSSRSVADTEP